MSRFTGFSEKSFLKKSEIWAKYRRDDIALNFSKELDTIVTDCSMRVLERLDFQSDVMQSIQILCFWQY